MKKTIQLLLFTSVFSLFAVSCKKDSELTKKNMFNHDNKDYELSNAYLENYGEDDGVYSMALTLTSSSIKIVEEDGEIASATGTGEFIGFEFISKTKELAVGEYRFDDDYENPNTFAYAAFGFNYNFETEKGSFLEITDGTVNVLKSGTEYELTFDLVAQDGKKVTGYFKGIPKVYGSSPINDIFLSKQRDFSMRKGFFTEAK